jgi:hypothetical protein
MTNVPGLPKVDQGQIEKDIRSDLKKKAMNPSSGFSAYSLGVAKVSLVNYEEFTVTLRVVLGEEQEFQRIPIPITFPGAGNRHFFGAMPQVGDYCVVGWMAQESGGDGKTVGTKIPVILTWILSGVWTGQDWMTTQPFENDEWSFSKKDSTMVKGAFERVRHKLRHMQPGNIVASSGQGSDLVLDEGVLLSNRRCNEIRLRDQDQAFTVRSLQQFHAMAGARIYAGAVQRDAKLLPTQLFSDGYDWSHPTQVNISSDTGLREPVHESSILEDLLPWGFLTPTAIMGRSPKTQGDLTRPWGPPLSSNLDPYQFLRRGLYIDHTGYLIYPDTIPSAVYGGKPIFRVSVPNDNDEIDNAALDSEAVSLTEHRLEIAHTTDRTLPVTEQTDMFDADRLPRTDPNIEDNNIKNPNVPFMEIVYGSVVGNDPFSIQGRDLYGQPLQPVIFDESGDPNPRMISGLGTDIGSHAASLFSMSPPTGRNESPTFWSVQKDGRFKFNIGGNARSNSVEGILEGGLKLHIKGFTFLDLVGGFQVRTRKGDSVENRGLEFISDQGGIRIYGGGNLTTGQVSEKNSPAGLRSPNPSPSVLIEGRDTVEIKSSQNFFIRSSLVQTTGSDIRIESLSTMDVQSGDRISVNTKSLDISVSGKTTQNYGGPKDLLPSNGPLREVSFSSLIPGLTVDKYSINFGNREETIDIGSHKTSIKVGDMTYETTTGTWKAKAGANELSLGTVTGMNANVVAGNVTIDAKAGATTISGTVSATLRTQGQATVSGTMGVYLGGGPVAKTGFIVSSADLDPLTGLPLVVFGMGSPAHKIGPSI